jgi:hypothetical protein
VIEQRQVNDQAVVEFVNAGTSDGWCCDPSDGWCFDPSDDRFRMRDGLGGFLTVRAGDEAQKDKEASDPRRRDPI